MAIKSSIGSVNGVVREPHAERYKGIDTERSYTRKDVDGLVLRTSGTLESMLADPGYSRLSIRAIIPTSELNYLRMQLARIGASVEAAIVPNSAESIAYIGYTKVDRLSSDAELASDRKRLAFAQASRNSDLRSILAQTRRSGFTVEMFQGGHNIDPMQAVALALNLQQFGYSSTSAVMAVLNNANNTIALTKDQKGEIVGSALIESAEIMFSDGSSMRIAELTDAAVLPRFSGNNIYMLMSTELVAYFNANHADEQHMLYAESNLQSASVLKTAARQGRSFSGILPKYTPIDGQYVGVSVNHFSNESILSISNLARL